MTALLTIVSLLMSAAGAAYLAVMNPKRRRAFGQEAVEVRPYLWISRLAVLGPGIVFLFLAQWAAMVLWAGGITVIGWGIAATSPDHLKSFEQWVTERRISLRNRLLGMRQHSRTRIVEFARKIAGSDAEISRLNARVAELELRNHELESQEQPRISIAASGGNK
ncbi:MAG: hypothetical protein AAGC81_06065 [Pseudomonadota bacterium]